MQLAFFLTCSDAILRTRTNRRHKWLIDQWLSQKFQTFEIVSHGYRSTVRSWCWFPGRAAIVIRLTTSTAILSADRFSSATEVSDEDDACSCGLWKREQKQWLGRIPAILARATVINGTLTLAGAVSFVAGGISLTYHILFSSIRSAECKDDSQLERVMMVLMSKTVNAVRRGSSTMSTGGAWGHAVCSA